MSLSVVILDVTAGDTQSDKLVICSRNSARERPEFLRFGGILLRWQDKSQTCLQKVDLILRILTLYEIHNMDLKISGSEC